MKFCPQCGAEVVDDAVICVKCGRSLGNNPSPAVGAGNPSDVPSVGFTVLSFFLPLIGAILFLMWNKTSPQKAMSCAKGLAIASIVGAAVGVISTIVWSSVLAGTMASFF